MKSSFSVCLIFVSLFIISQNDTSAQTVIRGPYLQSLTPYSIIIKWRTGSATNSRVRYGTDANNLTMTETVSGSFTNHAVKLSNLQPFTKYYYAVGNTTQDLSGPDSTHHFTTAPVPGTAQPVRVWVIGDFGKDNPGQRDVVTSYLNYLQGRHSDMWLWMGDNAYQSGTDAEYQTKVFDVYKSIMPFMPFYPCPGNHDYTSVCAIPCGTDPATHTGPYFDIMDVPTQGEAGGVPSGYELFYSFDYGNIHFVSLNSEVGSAISSSNDWTGANPFGNFNGSPMTTWLHNDLQANTKPWVVVYFHQPPYTIGSHNCNDFYEYYMQAMRENFTPIFNQYNVDLVVCGHSHVFERSKLMEGHTKSGSCNSDFTTINISSGKLSSNEPYIKFTDVANGEKGAVYVVIGNSGSTTSGTAVKHPAMEYTEYNTYGSVILEVEGNRLDGKYLRSDGSIQDHFTMYKTPSKIVKNVQASICQGQSYFAGGAAQTTAGVYYDTQAIALWPDTILVTNLTVIPSDTFDRAISACTGSSVFVGGANQTASGIYFDKFTNVNGCDSIVKTTLTFTPELAVNQNITICQGSSYFVGGANQTTAGVYFDSITGTAGCDTVLITTLAIQQPQQNSVNVSICEGDAYFAGGALQTSAGTYFDTLQTTFGCDSFLTTVLSVDPLPQAPQVSQLGNNLSVPAIYVSYQWYLDGNLISGAQLNLLQASTPGNYYVLVKDANGCEATSGVFTVVTSAIEVDENGISILPNPFDNSFTIHFEKRTAGKMQVMVFDVLGQMKYSFSDAGFDGQSREIDLSEMAAGIYFVKVQMNDNTFSKAMMKH